jgi:dipeptidyl-peptidase-3
MLIIWLGKIISIVFELVFGLSRCLCSAAWLGSRIILRQVSPESLTIYDFILELYASCSGDWNIVIGPDITIEHMRQFLTYAATFLSNIGNYYVSSRRSLMLGWID